MVSALTLKIIYFGADIHELKITASNGQFSGSVNLYVGIGRLTKFADEIAGFPMNSKDRREVELGTFERGFAGGGVRIVFVCTDSSGHAQLQIRMETDHNELDPAQTISLLLPVEAASIDNFVSELRAMETDISNEACLRETLHKF